MMIIAGLVAAAPVLAQQTSRVSVSSGGAVGDEGLV